MIRQKCADALSKHFSGYLHLLFYVRSFGYSSNNILCFPSFLSSDIQSYNGAQPKTYPTSIAALEVCKCCAPDTGNAFDGGITLHVIIRFSLRPRGELHGKDAMDKANAGTKWRSLQIHHS